MCFLCFDLPELEMKRFWLALSVPSNTCYKEKGLLLAYVFGGFSSSWSVSPDAFGLLIREHIMVGVCERKQPHG